MTTEGEGQRLLQELGVGEDARLNDLAKYRPLLRAHLVARLVSRGQFPADLIDSIETAGEAASWIQESGGSRSPSAGDLLWPLSTPRAVIRPVARGDYGAIHEALNDPGSNWRLPSRGRTVLPAQVESAIEGADLQMVGASVAQPAIAVSLMSLNRHDPADRTADLTVIGLSRNAESRRIYRPPRAIRFETVGMFIGHAFRALDLHKLTAAIPDYNWDQFADGVGPFVELEGTRIGQILRGGERHDVHLVAIFREKWVEVEDWLVPALGNFAT